MQLITGIRKSDSHVYFALELPEALVSELINTIQIMEPAVQRVIVEVTL